MTDPFRPRYLLADNRLAVYAGDGSERCLVCGTRDPQASLYVGQAYRFNDEGLPERFPVCDDDHALMWMRAVWLRSLGPIHGERLRG